MLRGKIIIFIILVAFVTAIGITGTVKAEVIAYDADGQYLGIFNGYEQGGADIYIPSSDINIIISWDSGDVGSPLYSLKFESSDCSGTPYIGSRASYYVTRNGEKIYSGDRIVPIRIEYNSYLRTDGLTCKQSSKTAYVVLAQEFTPPFTLPIALPLYFEVENCHSGQRGKR